MFFVRSLNTVYLDHHLIYICCGAYTVINWRWQKTMLG